MSAIASDIHTEKQRKKRNTTIIVVSIIVFIALCILAVYLYNRHRDKLVDDAITKAFAQTGGSMFCNCGN